MPRTGVSTPATAPFKCLEKYFKTVAELGFDFIEPNLGGPIFREHRRDSIELVRSYCSSYGIDLSVHLPCMVFHIGSPRNKIREGAVAEIKAYIDIAAEMGASRGVLYLSSSVTDHSGWKRETIVSFLVESIRDLCRYASIQGMDLSLKNDRTFITAREMPEVLDFVDTTMSFDTGQAQISGMDSDDIAKFLSENYEIVGNLLLNDLRGPDEQHLPTGAGTLELDKILTPIIDGDWSGTIVLDLSVNDHEYIQLSKQRLDELFQDAR